MGVSFISYLVKILADLKYAFHRFKHFFVICVCFFVTNHNRSMMKKYIHFVLRLRIRGILIWQQRRDFFLPKTPLRKSRYSTLEIASVEFIDSNTSE